VSSKTVTFYGHFSGWSSYPTVCKAITRWLHDQGVDLLLCDLRPERLFDGVEDIPQASKATHRGVAQRARQQTPFGSQSVPAMPGTSLLFGFPPWAGAIPRHATAVGYHVGDVDVIPQVWTHYMNQEDIILTPSKWCRSAFLRSGVKRPVEVVQHGISNAFQPRGGDAYGDLIHFCSAKDPARKGTVELIAALEGVRDKMLDFGAKLRVYSASPAVEMFIASRPWRDIIEVKQDTPGTPESMAAKLWRASMVVQPSRAEGYGVIPMEALYGCGVPVVATSCTGHAEYLEAETPGAAIVPTGSLEPCSGARAPSLEPRDIQKALSTALSNYWELAEAARTRAPQIRPEWTWDAVLSRSGLLRALHCA